jgi:hypothetical protein
MKNMVGDVGQPKVNRLVRRGGKDGMQKIPLRLLTSPRVNVNSLVSSLLSPIAHY